MCGFLIGKMRMLLWMKIRILPSLFFGRAIRPLPVCLANSRIANSRTGHLADWSTRGLDNSRTSQLADWTSRGLDYSRSRRCRQKGKLSTQSRWWHPRVVQSVTCPVRESSSPRVVQSASWQSASWRIRELSSNLMAKWLDGPSWNLALAT